MKKSLSILFLLILVFLSGGYHFYYSIQRAALKKEMKKNIASLDKTALKIFHFTAAEYKELDWEDGSEFEWKGKMYDVVTENESNGLMVIACIPDEKETALLDALMKAQENTHHNGIIILKLLSQDFIFPEAVIPNLTSTHVSIDYNLYKLNLTSALETCPTQPPEAF